MFACTRQLQVLGAILSVLLLWFATVAGVLTDIVPSDLTKVYIYDGCINNGTVTVLIFCMLEVLVGCWFLRRFGLPIIFGDSWEKFDSLKQQKLIGFIAQIIVRSACCGDLLTILFGGWGQQITLQGGLFEHHNAKAAYDLLRQKGIPTTCAKSGMDNLDVAAIRAWTFAKYHMVAIHIWELAFIPQLTVDGWLHHLFVVLVAAISCQPQTLTGNSSVQPLIDLIGFSFILGASLNFLVKTCVVMYHYAAPRALVQARWMEGSIAGAWLILIFFYIGFPGFVAFQHADKFETGTLIAFILLPIAFLSLVEVRLITVKRSIARNARKKVVTTPECLWDSRQLSTTSLRSVSSRPSHDNQVPLAADGHRSAASSFKVLVAFLDPDRLDSASDEWKESLC